MFLSEASLPDCTCMKSTYQAYGDCGANKIQAAPQLCIDLGKSGCLVNNWHHHNKFWKSG